MYGTYARGTSARGRMEPVVAWNLCLRGTCVCKELLFPVLALFIAVAIAIRVE